MDDAGQALAQRFDFATVKNRPQRTPQGFLRIDANVTRTGVLIYRQPDGSEFRELRLPEEVFNADSLASLADAPVTDLHPKQGLVTPSNSTELSRGHVAGQAVREDSFVAAKIVVVDEALIKAVERGDRREVSCGYTCRLDATPGVYEGQPYDAIQRNIVYNHVALGPKGWGRAGGEVALKMDSGLVSYESKAGSGPDEWYQEPVESAVGRMVREKLKEMGKGEGHLAEHLGIDIWSVKAFLNGAWGAIRSGHAMMNPNAMRPPETGLAKSADFQSVASFIGADAAELFKLVPESERGDGSTQKPKQRKAMETIVIKIDGVDYEMPKAVAPHVERAVAAKDAAIKAAGEKVDALQAKADGEKVRADGLAAELEATKTKLVEAESQARIDGLVAERVGLETIARKLLGADARFDGKSNKDIKIECIAKVDEKFDAKDKSDIYIQGRFDGVVNGVTAEAERADKKDDAARAALDARNKNGGVVPDADKARADAKERSANAWRQPLTISKEARTA